MPDLAALPTLYLGHDKDSFQASIDMLQSILQKNKLLMRKSGDFDESTKIAVQEFQYRKGLQVDGWVGSLTWSSLLYPTLSLKEKPSSENERYICKLQKLLQKERFQVKINGCFDTTTERALKKFQKRYYIEPDGICGPQTWSTLLGQRLSWDVNERLDCRNFIFEQIFMVLSIQIGMYFNPFNIGVEIPFFNALVASYSLTFCVHPFLKPLFSDYLDRFDFPLLKFAPYVITGFIWRQIFELIQHAVISS